jgi:hypothetical protein
MPGPDGYYSHWGQTRVQGKTKGQFAWMQEPMDNTAMCSCAAKQQAFGFPPAWGWISTQCSFEAVFVCRKPTTVAFSYNSSSGITFIYNTTATSQADAEFSCRENGGHLASYASSMEQVGPHAAGGPTRCLAVRAGCVLAARCSWQPCRWLTCFADWCALPAPARPRWRTTSSTTPT